MMLPQARCSKVSLWQMKWRPEWELWTKKQELLYKLEHSLNVCMGELESVQQALSILEAELLEGMTTLSTLESESTIRHEVAAAMVGCCPANGEGELTSDAEAAIAAAATADDLVTTALEEVAALNERFQAEVNLQEQVVKQAEQDHVSSGCNDVGWGVVRSGC